MKKRILSAVLAMLCISMTTACGAGDPETPAAVTSAPVSETAAPETVEETEAGRAAAKDSLPSDLDLGGRTIRLLTRRGDPDCKLEFDVTEQTGDIVEDAVYKRNITVSEKYNFNLQLVGGEDAPHASGTVVNEALQSSVLAGSNDYDLIGNHMSQGTTAVLQGLLLNLRSVDYLDFDQPWWNSSYLDAVTIHNKTYLAAGELALMMVSNVFGTYFNKTIYNNYYPGEDLYEIVNSGGWTMDLLSKYCSGVYSDVNGSGLPDDGDQFGMIYEIRQVHADAFAGGARIQYTTFDKDANTCKWTLENERTATFLDKMKSMVFDNPGTFPVPQTRAHITKDILYFLRDDLALFTVDILYCASVLRDMESDYGIVPLPKLDETQDDYSSQLGNSFTVFGIPVTCDRPDEIGAAMEGLCAESYRTVTPTYFEQALKVKYARDNEASQMLDICVGNLYFDTAVVFNQVLNTAAAVFRVIMTDSSTLESGMSTIKSREESTNELLQTLIDTYTELPE